MAMPFEQHQLVWVAETNLGIAGLATKHGYYLEP